MLKDVLSENREVAAKAIQNAIKADRYSEKKKKAWEGINYYKGQHEILDYRLFYFDSNGLLKEDKFKSNIKIQHQYHTELVDQKVQYLLSNPLEVKTEDEQLQERLEEYINEDFQETLQNAVEGASNKGFEYVYTYKNADDITSFQVADSLGVITINDDVDTSKTLGILRYYETTVTNKEDREVKITKAEVWTDKDTTYYTETIDKTTFKFDDTVKPNPKPHIVLEDDKAFYDGGGLGYIPFFKLQNNKYEQTDLEPIKAIIDDYDLMACSLSNNLQDFQEAIYVVKGYPGDDLTQLTTNLKTKKTISVDAEGGLDVKTIDIPTEARTVKLNLDKEAIYKFGMGFDSSQVGDGNITNIVIKSRYALLDLKCNKAEMRLRKLVRQLLKIIVDDINVRFGTKYSYKDIKINIVRETMVNEDSVVANKKTEAEAVNQRIAAILTAANTISQDSKLKLICEVLELDYEEEKKLLEVEGPYNIDDVLPDEGGGIVE
ncbi:MAG: phage portal protein [Sedimentibacter sp.]|uniref:phage portal protein n=1 Tax=Sedimentibacter sp. TaxID=1960295 RepID=UPI002981C2AE|nr:phage portal protein [Sedimentibacter sp.]MDW5300747.1 phage portal protein [Sedimentibacter sp.]